MILTNPDVGRHVLNQVAPGIVPVSNNNVETSADPEQSTEEKESPVVSPVSLPTTPAKIKPSIIHSQPEEILTKELPVVDLTLKQIKIKIIEYLLQTYS